MADFGALPPEVVSTQLYSGAGSGPLTAAAAAWEQLATALGSASGSYRSVVTGLAGESWQGPASAAMAAAAEPYLAWLTATAAQAGATAGQARAAAAAYEAARAAAVPPAVVAANRSALSSLVTGNVLGQNSAAIAANQAQYSAMWAQDAAAMQAYSAGSSAAATSLTAFSQPAQSSDPAAAGNQAAANQAAQAAANPAQGLKDFLNNNPLESFLNSGPVTDLENMFNQNVGLLVGGLGAPTFDAASIMLGGPNFPVNGAVAAALSYGAVAAGMPELASATSREPGAEPVTLAGTHAPGPGGGGPAGTPQPVPAAARPVSAGIGHAAPIGELSVPPSWNTATPQGIRLAANPLPSTGFPAVPQATIAPRGGLLGHLPAVVGVVNAPRKAKPAKGRAGAQAAVRIATAADGDRAQREPADADRPVPTAGRTELERMRQAVAELTLRRDRLQETAAEMIEKTTR